jgi:acyl carrier protein
VSPTSELFGKKISLLIKSKLGLDTIDWEVPIKEQTKFDSLDHMELIMDLEDQYGIEIYDEDFSRLETVIDFIDYIKERV